MIAPTNRLIFWTAAVFLPCALVVSAVPEWTLLVLGIMGVFTVLAVVDAVLSTNRFGALHLEFIRTNGGAPLFRLTKDRAGMIGIHIANRDRQPRSLVVGLSFPPSVESVEETKIVSIGEQAEEYRLDWPVTPHKRGEFFLENIYAAMDSVVGFWRCRRVFPDHVELRVYPNLLGERNRVAAIFLNRGALGLHARRRVGKGREFEKLREYIPGDSFEDIHWKATARRAHPITKVYQVERTQEVYVILDASRLSGRTLQDPAQGSVSQLDRFIHAAMILGMVAERQGDLFGLLTFSDRIHGFVRARNGREHYTVCRDALYTLEPNDVTPDFDEVCSFIRTRLRRRALLVFLTNLDDPVLSETFARSMDLITRRHLILANMLTPAGVGPLFDRSEVSSVDDVYKRLSGHLQWRDLRELQRILHRRGVALGLLENESLTPELVSQYLSIKQRQIL
ncbi:MAG TPA: DUF58 domain-containing protein [Candidatus Hydrogenedentes bacterium]|nr:DUF58 domain-containing protein [Candidatus Hydrogenedentota bacterium]